MSLPEPGSKDGRDSKTAGQEDRDFDPSAEALIDEIDDERTLEEEEALDRNNESKVQEELDDLKKESEMPIEELLAYYERMRNEAGGEAEEDELDDEDELIDEEDDEEDEDGDIEGSEGAENQRKGFKEDLSDGGDGGSGDTADSQRKPTPSNLQKSPHQARKDDQPSQASRRPLEQPVHVSATKKPPSPCSIAQQRSKESSCDSDSSFVPHKSANQTSTPLSSTTSSSVTHNLPSSTIQASRISSSLRLQEESGDAQVSSGANLVQSEPVSTQQTELRHRTDDRREPTDCDPGVTRSDVVGLAPRRKHAMTNFILDQEPNEMFKALLGYDLDDSDDMDEDYSYTDDENGDDERDWRRSIHVGPEYQADVPEGLSEYDDLPPYENEDKPVWRCNPNLSDEQILNYLKTASALSKRTDVSISPANVPKISIDTMRSYQQRMQELSPDLGSPTAEHNNFENIINENPPECLPDLYLNRRGPILIRSSGDNCIEQENTLDAIGPACDMSTIDNNRQAVATREENSNSTSQDARPEVSTEEYFQDEEQLLYLLLQCNHNLDEALRRRGLDPFKYYLHEPMSLWSQEECLGFEHGLKIYGKDFRAIRENRVQTRTHAELVAFYYLWKKSERHDIWNLILQRERRKFMSETQLTN